MPVFVDQLNREVYLPAVPKRIVSIVPSQTELLFYLGLDKKITGITKFCVHPSDKFKTKTKIGGTKQLDLAKIKQLSPDLIIANKEENERSQVEALMDICPVWISNINDLQGAVDMIQQVGALVEKEAAANKLVQDIKLQFDQTFLEPLNLRAAYFIWRKPYMVAAKNTFIDSMLQHCGLVNAFASQRYPEVNEQQLIAANPDVVLLSSEPYPFKDIHVAELQAILPNAVIKLVDGEIFSWYGSRLLYAPAYFQKLSSVIKSSIKF